MYMYPRRPKEIFLFFILAQTRNNTLLSIIEWVNYSQEVAKLSWIMMSFSVPANYFSFFHLPSR